MENVVRITKYNENITIQKHMLVTLQRVWNINPLMLALAKIDIFKAKA